MKKIILGLCATILLNGAQIFTATDQSEEANLEGEPGLIRRAVEQGQSRTLFAHMTIVDLSVSRFFFQAFTQDEDGNKQILRDIKTYVQERISSGSSELKHLYLPDCSDRRVENWYVISNLHTSEEPTLVKIAGLLNPTTVQHLVATLEKTHTSWPQETRSCFLSILDNELKYQAPSKTSISFNFMCVTIEPDYHLPWGTQKRKLIPIRNKTVKTDLELTNECVKFTQRTLKDQVLSRKEKDFSNWLWYKHVKEDGNIICFFLPPQCEKDFKRIAESIVRRLDNTERNTLSIKERFFREYPTSSTTEVRFYSIRNIQLFNRNCLAQYPNH